MAFFITKVTSARFKYELKTVLHTVFSQISASPSASPELSPLEKALFVYTGCCTTFCKGGNPLLQTYLRRLKLNFSSRKFIKRPKGKMIFLKSDKISTLRNFVYTCTSIEISAFFGLFGDWYSKSLKARMSLTIYFCYSWLISWFGRWDIDHIIRPNKQI